MLKHYKERNFIVLLGKFNCSFGILALAPRLKEDLQRPTKAAFIFTAPKIA